MKRYRILIVTFAASWYKAELIGYPGPIRASGNSKSIGPLVRQPGGQKPGGKRGFPNVPKTTDCACVSLLSCREAGSQVVADQTGN
jgi:hypothetical protein